LKLAGSFSSAVHSTFDFGTPVLAPLLIRAAQLEIASGPRALPRRITDATGADPPRYPGLASTSHFTTPQRFFGSEKGCSPFPAGLFAALTLGRPLGRISGAGDRESRPEPRKALPASPALCTSRLPIKGVGTMSQTDHGPDGSPPRQTTNRLGYPVPPCPGCGTPPAASGDVDSVCPRCGEYKFDCGLVEHLPSPQGPDPAPTTYWQQMAIPHWERLPLTHDRAPPGQEPPSNRLALDPQTQTVTLDGAPYQVDDPKAFAVYQEIASAGPQPLTGADIRGRVRGCHGAKKVRQLLDSLPGPIRATIRSGPNGYWLNLAPPRPRRKRRT
jgi:hypothetical protein